MSTFPNKTSQYKFNPEISKELNKLTVLDNYHVIIALLQDWGIIILSSIVAHYYFYFYPICLIIIGSRQRGLGNIFHDSTHGNIVKNRRLCNITGTFLSGYWVGLSMSDYRESHVKLHHNYLGNIKVDPDYQYYHNIGIYGEKITPKDFLFAHIIPMLLLFRVPGDIFYFFKNRILAMKTYPLDYCKMVTCWVVAFIIAIYYHKVDILFFYWIIPFFTTYNMIDYIIQMAEHYPLLGKSTNVLYLSRNRFSHWLEAIFLSIRNENYHLVHHLRPAIPFWNLAKAHKIMMKDMTYRKINQNFGGIFYSSNGNNSFIPILCSKVTWRTMSTLCE